METRKPDSVKRIGIIGPESSGKTWLSEHLAAHFHTIWVKEYAREYLSILAHSYTFQDIENIYRRQLILENQAANTANKLLFSDTTLHVSKIWMCNFVGFCPVWIDEFLQKPHYSLILLLVPDLPWQPDPLREHPQLTDRLYFFDLYQKELENQTHTPWCVIQGQGAERLKNAIEAVNKWV